MAHDILIVVLFLICIYQERRIDKLAKIAIVQDKLNTRIIELSTRNMEQLGLFLSGKI